ncbi:integrase catalytic domain-containing protein [Trichonephila clavata]|uniref:Integrase catalytic domain-containing protein n=1 Tax=Trichonephila clavata TaxID=2740835 RepID=A0A8X6LZQ7_TRICU|nr:integrase catalytic domain-containing protein [Trichonephila clavata]
MLEAILVTIDTQLVPSVINSVLEAINKGVTEEWLAFSDLFEAAVSNNQNLTGAQKLQYLKGSLRSDALSIVNSLFITNDNFEIAWKLLKDRYFNKREIMSSLMKKFINITPLSGESSTQILNLMLESLEYKVDPTSDTLLMHMILFKLDTNSRTWFERTFPTDAIPRLDELLQFLATQARSITSSFTKRNVQRKVTLVASNAQSQCPLCNGDHTLSRCDTFLKLSVQGRSDFVKTNNVCFNCLTQFHGVKTCKSKFRCKRCKTPHHSLLHIENASARGRQGAVNVLNSSGLSVNAPVFSPVPIPGSSEPRENSRVVDVTSCISDVNPDIQILLCTALIQVRDIWGNYQTCKCLLDSGSQASLFTNECIERLGLRKEKANARISCLGASDTRTNGIAEIQFTPHFSSQNSFHASVYVINKIVGMIPHHDLDSSMRELFGDISLADPAFYKSSPIDVLLGVDLTLPLLRGQTLSMGKDKPFAIHSELGWIIGGRANSSGQNSLQVNHIQLVSNHLINKFWELDSVPCAKPLTSLEEAGEDHFLKTHSRDENGRYTVRLPFHSPPTRLGNSKQNAIRRLVSVEQSHF